MYARLPRVPNRVALSAAITASAGRSASSRATASWIQQTRTPLPSWSSCGLGESPRGSWATQSCNTEIVWSRSPLFQRLLANSYFLCISTGIFAWMDQPLDVISSGTRSHCSSSATRSFTIASEHFSKACRSPQNMEPIASQDFSNSCQRSELSGWKAS